MEMMMKPARWPKTMKSLVKMKTNQRREEDGSPYPNIGGIEEPDSVGDGWAIGDEQTEGGATATEQVPTERRQRWWRLDPAEWRQDDLDPRMMRPAESIAEDPWAATEQRRRRRGGLRWLGSRSGSTRFGGNEARRR